MCVNVLNSLGKKIFKRILRLEKINNGNRKIKTKDKRIWGNIWSPK